MEEGLSDLFFVLVLVGIAFLIFRGMPSGAAEWQVTRISEQTRAELLIGPRKTRKQVIFRIIGGILVTAGVVMLLDSLGLLRFIRLESIASGIILLIGIILLFRSFIDNQTKANS